jgi:hypothetical protein
MSLRRPTVALMLFTFDISPLCGVALTPDCGMLIYFFYLSRRRFRHPIDLQLFYWDFGRNTAWLPCYLSCGANLLPKCELPICSCASCLHLLYLMSKLSCEYIQSAHLACWFGQMLTNAILWMKSTIASPTPRGVPVSPLRSWSWSLVLYTLQLPLWNHQASLPRLRSGQILETCDPLLCDISTTTFYYELVVMPPHPLCHIRLNVQYWRACNKLLSSLSSTLCNI